MHAQVVLLRLDPGMGLGEPVNESEDLSRPTRETRRGLRPCALDVRDLVALVIQFAVSRILRLVHRPAVSVLLRIALNYQSGIAQFRNCRFGVVHGFLPPFLD
jgi:hypothetical protein